jgi:glycosyltransferase involved in cell wall biosynthesis
MDIIGGLVACWNRLRWVLSERASQEAYQSMTILAFLRCRLARYASAVVANSEDGALYWRHTLPAGTTVTTIPNAVDVAAVRDSCPSTHDDFGNDGPRFLFVGRLVPQKAPEVFVQSLALMPTSRPLYGLIIGEGPMRHDIQANIQFHGLSSRIRVLPYQENWWGLLKTTTALVSPSRFEGQPNVVLEAMAAECPLIVSDIRPHRSILDERSAVFVPKDDPRALADALLAFLEDPQGARQRVERAHAQVTRFTVDVTAEAYETVYTRVLAGRSS